MKIAAAQAIASIVSPSELNAEFVIPQAFNLEVAPAVAAAVTKAAMDSGVARKKVDPAWVAQNLYNLLAKQNR